MSVALRITHRDLEPTDAIDGYIRKRAEKLESCGTTISHCRVVVDAPHRHKLHGRHYTVLIEVGTPHGEIVVDRAPDGSHEQEDLYAAIDAAFDHAVRRLHDIADRAIASHRKSEVQT